MHLSIPKPRLAPSKKHTLYHNPCNGMEGPSQPHESPRRKSLIYHLYNARGGGYCPTPLLLYPALPWIRALELLFHGLNKNVPKMMDATRKKGQKEVKKINRRKTRMPSKNHGLAIPPSASYSHTDRITVANRKSKTRPIISGAPNIDASPPKDEWASHRTDQRPYCSSDISSFGSSVDPPRTRCKRRARKLSRWSS